MGCGWWTYEDDNRVQDAEFRACRPERQTDDDGVEDHAEFEDKECGNLGTEGIGDDDGVSVGGGVVGRELGVFLIGSVSEPVRVGTSAGHVQVVSVGGSVSLSGIAADVGRDEVFDVGFAHVVETVLCLDVALSGEVEEEGDEGGKEGEGGRPGVGRPASGHADAGQRTDFAIGGVEETVEGGY